MTDSPDPEAAPAPRPVVGSVSADATNRVQVEAMQALLVRMLQDVIDGENLGGRTRAEALVEANERLLLTALQSQADADAARQALHRVTQSARTDSLTGLPNRATLLDHFDQAVAGARRHGSRMALLFVDLDRFKPLNDAWGHAFGDQVLQQVAQRLQATVREGDTVSRHGGDEFVVLLPEITQADDAQAVADKLAHALARPMPLDGHVITLSASIGVAHYPADGLDLDSLVSHADEAMYTEKRRHHEPSPADEASRDAPPPPPSGPALRSLREANEQLVVTALNAQQLQEAAERARLRQAAFLDAISRELADPRAQIRIASLMLGRQADEAALLPRVQKVVAQRMADVSRLVDAVQLDSGGLKIRKLPLNMAHVVERAVARGARVRASRRQRLVREGPPGPWMLAGDEDRLQLVVGNLLDNASRFTLEGGCITLAVDLEPDRLTLTVGDDGVGIPPELLPVIFEPFVQDPRALAWGDGGLGIGLTVARGLAHAHGGEITASSAGSGRGSRFVLTLPRGLDASPADVVS